MKISFTRWGCCGLYLWHEPTELSHSFLFCSCVYFCPYFSFNCISFRHYHHHHQSLNREGRWGTTDDLATNFLHFSLYSTALWDLPNFRPVHSLMLSSHLFLCPPCLLPPFTVPCKMVWARPDERETWLYHATGVGTHGSICTVPKRFTVVFEKNTASCLRRSVNSIQSNPVQLSCGVPQGPVLGPFLFTLPSTPFSFHHQPSQPEAPLLRWRLSTL